MTIEDLVLRDLHRAAREAGRRGVAVPSVDLAGAPRSLAVSQQAIRRLVQAGRVVRVRRDLLVLPDETGLVNVGMADLVDAIAPQPYLITAGAALENAGLTDQHYFGLAVLTPSEVAELRHNGETATFFATNESNIWGHEHDSRLRYATPERALVDALNHPRYGVSLTQILDALLRATARDRAFLDRLLEVVLRYGAGSKGHSSRSAVRRTGLLVERLFGPDSASPYRDHVGLNRTPTLLRPGGPPDGAVDPTWRVVVNALIEPELVP